MIAFLSSNFPPSAFVIKNRPNKPNMATWRILTAYFTFITSLSLLVQSVTSLRKTVDDKKPPLTVFKDVFIGGIAGRPHFGSYRTTCWARGGVCVNIRDCPDVTRMDSMVAGCDWGYKVCCKVLNFGPPTVGSTRQGMDSNNVELSLDSKHLDSEWIKAMARGNTAFLSDILADSYNYYNTR